MQSSRTITLFSELPRTRRRPSAVLTSILLHVLVIGAIYLGLRHAVRVEEIAPQRYTVRLLNLRRPEPRARRKMIASGDRGGGALQAPRASQAAAAPSIAAGGAPAAPSLPVEMAQTIPAPQTVVQPDLPPNLLLPKPTPIPLVLLWSPDNDPVKQIVAPPPQVTAVANVHPSLQTPNRELTLADLKISSSALVVTTPSLPPSSTTPLAVRGPARVAQVPATVSKPAGPPTPARVMSLSDLQLEQGAIALPLVNETAPAGSSATLAPGRPGKSTGTSAGKPDVADGGNGAKEGSGSTGEHAAAGGAGLHQAGAPNGANAGLGSGPATGLVTGSGGAPEMGSGPAAEPLLTRIDLPKDGHFGVVVVGSSLAEKYPETVGLWSGRLAYTVYLRVGLTKSWILQYALPRNAQAAAGGAAVRPEAPWPYMIERPHLAQGDIDADAIMVHGFVNMSGRFEQLAVVFPAEFAQSKFVLNALQQWEFRPALQNGKLAMVEVLLIIPDQGD